MEDIRRIIGKVRGSISEYESKRILASYDIPVTEEKLVDNAEELIRVADKIGFPVVLRRLPTRGKGVSQVRHQKCRRSCGGLR